MPSLSGRFDPNIGVLINVGVAPANTLGTVTAPAGISITAFPALIDTGASSTCVSPSLATAIGITPIGMRPMISATHSVPTNVYLVDLVLPFGGSSVVLPSVSNGVQCNKHDPISAFNRQRYYLQRCLYDEF